MAITQLETRNPDFDTKNLVAKIVGNLPAGTEGFRQASQMYDSTFFEQESEEFRMELCAALMAKFTDCKNNYWIEHGANNG